YSQVTHRVAGGVLLLVAVLTAWEAWRPRRFPWSALSSTVFVLFGLYLIPTSDPESWPWGPGTFMEIFTDPLVLQHKLLALVPLTYGVIGALRSAGVLARSYWYAVVPTLAILAGGGLAGPRASALAQDDPVLAGRPLVRYPEKTDLILLTSRPPQLETPMKYFDRAITPNEAFFVRYHVFPIPLEVDLATWRLRITGRVDRPLELSLDDLKTRFPRAAVTAVNQCSGNSRGRFTPRVLGGQWGDGAMGNAEWVGARLKDILTAAGVRQGAVQATFDGLDKPAFPSVPDFVKSLDIARIMEDQDILVAYQMNGAPLPMLNGYPARLVVP